MGITVALSVVLLSNGVLDAEPPRIAFVAVETAPDKIGPHNQAAWRTVAGLGQATLLLRQKDGPFTDTSGNARSMSEFDVVWYHQGEAIARNAMYHGQSLAEIRRFADSGGGVLLSGAALAMVAQLGLETLIRPQRHGDQRALITRIADKTTAVLYEPVNPTSKTPAVEFGSPLRTLRFDRVCVISDQIEFATTTRRDLEVDPTGDILCTIYEVAIPLTLLHFQPTSDTNYKFDVGILRGDGQRTLQRVHWHNKASGRVSDIPSEAELIPTLWATLHLQ